ncbi:MAG: hypothetical protein K9G76_02730 [Bacteroidales bacterium]|nr:hypothetical protein [Bacteroidales bacterium]MCF8405918.1 hypothetical protein [Bacteroidales bacterium]
MTIQHTYDFKKYLVILTVLLLVAVSVKSQENRVVSRLSIAQALTLKFANKEVELVKGQIISNVLTMVNTSEEPISIYITLNHPPMWKTLFNSDKKYTIGPADTIYVPVRIIPSAMMKGDTKYFINAYIEDEQRRQVAGEYFFASTEKISEWEMTANPSSRIYLKNNENTANFNINLANTGNEKQELVMMSALASSNIILMDSTEKPIVDFKSDFSLDAYTDTTISYKVKYTETERNFKSIDIENYNPGSINDEKKFSVFFHSEEPRREKYSNKSRSSKLDFIKLSNDKKINPYGSDVLPLSAYLRVSNILEDIVFSSLHLRGQKLLNNGGQLLYNTSLYFSSMDKFYGQNYARNIPWYVGYFDKTKSIQAGYVNGGAVGVQSSGKGVKGEIEFLPNHWGGAYYVRSPYFFKDDKLESFGFHHRYDGDNFSNLTQYSHSHHKYAKLITDVISVSPKVKLAKKHNLNFILALSNRKNYLNPNDEFTRQGYMAGAGYTSSFVENKWRFNLRGTYTSQGFGAYGYERYYLNHRSRIAASENLEISINNNYNQYNYDKSYFNYIPGYERNFYLFNSVNFYSEKYLKSVKPGLFYDIRNHFGYNFHTRGLNFSYNKYDITKNLQASMINTIGFARIMDEAGKKEHFTYKLSSMIKYHSLSFTGYYNYGPMSPAMVQLKRQTNVIPQTIRFSFIHMHLFKNRHVALQSRASYMYTNVYNHHSVNVSPEIFYFTNSGWRFSLNPTFTFYSSRLRVNTYEVPAYVTEADYEFKRYTNDNFLIAFGVKKDFGIPIPTTFTDFNNVTFAAFYDLNGNKIQDDNEPGIENVVIKVGSWNVITRSDGSASFENADPGHFSFSAFPLEDLKGWFPLIDDTLTIFKDEQVYIPFVKGVKIMGNVFIEQENTNLTEDKMLDKSGIKISAVNGHSFHTLTGADGAFEFYLPFGEYTVTLDETVLNGRYYIVKNNYVLDLSKDVENMYITFHIIEKKRKIRIKSFNGSTGNTDGEE